MILQITLVVNEAEAVDPAMLLGDLSGAVSSSVSRVPGVVSVQVREIRPEDDVPVVATPAATSSPEPVPLEEA